MGHHPETKRVYRRMTARQMDYLEFLKHQNVEIYGEVLALFTQDISNVPSGESTPPQMNGWDGSPNERRKKKEMEITQRPGYAL